MNQFENVKTYTELKMRLDLLGIGDYPPERLFDMARTGVDEPDEEFGKWLSRVRWTRFCNALQARIDSGTCLSSMTSVNCGL
jgi:hypothetical protein